MSLNGKKVKIKADELLKVRNLPTFTKWVNEHRDDVFTARLFKGYSYTYCFDEDKTQPKWLFHEEFLELVD